FTKPLLKLLLLGGTTLEIDDMSAVDPSFHSGKVLYILESHYKRGPSPMALADLGLTFEDAPQPDVFPDLKHELCPGGAGKSVTEDNKKQYLALLCDYRLRASVLPQVEAMLKGLRAVMPEEVQQRMQR
ncbi:unnamed protein product, partial [Polarella glacialis]